MATAVFAWWQARPGRGPEVEQLLLELRSRSLDEPGCRAYEVHRDPDDGDRFLLYEVYDDEAAYEAHADSPHFAELAKERGFPLLADRRREFYTRVSDGAGSA